MWVFMWRTPDFHSGVVLRIFFTATSVVLYVHSPFYLMAIKQSEREAIHDSTGKHPIHACLVCRITTVAFYVIISIIIAIVLVVVVPQMVSTLKRPTGRYLCSAHTAQYSVHSSGAADPVIAAPFAIVFLPVCFQNTWILWFVMMWNLVVPIEGRTQIECCVPPTRAFSAWYKVLRFHAICAIIRPLREIHMDVCLAYCMWEYVYVCVWSDWIYLIMTCGVHLVYNTLYVNVKFKNFGF